MNKWQMIRTDNWIYGEKIRGIIRTRLAEIWARDHGGWQWVVGDISHGVAESLLSAIEKCEDALGEKL